MSQSEEGQNPNFRRQDQSGHSPRIETGTHHQEDQTHDVPKNPPPLQSGGVRDTPVTRKNTRATIKKTSLKRNLFWGAGLVVVLIVAFVLGGKFISFKNDDEDQQVIVDPRTEEHQSKIESLAEESKTLQSLVSDQIEMVKTIKNGQDENFNTLRRSIEEFKTSLTDQVSEQNKALTDRLEKLESKPTATVVASPSGGHKHTPGGLKFGPMAPGDDIFLTLENGNPSGLKMSQVSINDAFKEGRHIPVPTKVQRYYMLKAIRGSQVGRYLMADMSIAADRLDLSDPEVLKGLKERSPGKAFSVIYKSHEEMLKGGFYRDATPTPPGWAYALLHIHDPVQ